MSDEQGKVAKPANVVERPVYARVSEVMALTYGQLDVALYSLSNAASTLDSADKGGLGLSKAVDILVGVIDVLARIRHETADVWQELSARTAGSEEASAPVEVKPIDKKLD